jgi:hypothetical protein
MLLELITLDGFPSILVSSISFPSKKNLMKNSWKLKVNVPNNCTHLTLKTTSTPSSEQMPMWQGQVIKGTKVPTIVITYGFDFVTRILYFVHRL